MTLRNGENREKVLEAKKSMRCEVRTTRCLALRQWCVHKDSCSLLLDIPENYTCNLEARALRSRMGNSTIWLPGPHSACYSIQNKRGYLDPKPTLCFRGQTFSTVNQPFFLISPYPKTLLTKFMKDQSKRNNFNRPVARTYAYPASFMAQALFWRYLAHVKESGEFLVVESGIVGFEIQNTARGIRSSTYHCNPESKFHWQRLKYSS